MSAAQFNPQRWRLYRGLYYTALAALFALIGFYIGPNLIMFHKLTGLTPADFTGAVEKRGVPTVRAIKEFVHEHGRFPDPRLEELNIKSTSAILEDGRLRLFSLYNHTLTYTFGDDEHWEVSGPFATGRIPLPPVTLSPTTRQSATTRTTS